MSHDIKVGDHVEWDSRQGHSVGVVEKKLTHDKKIKSYIARATEDSPQFLVKSDATGAEAAHKPEALTKVSESESKSQKAEPKDTKSHKESSSNKKKEDSKKKETKSHKKAAAKEDEEEEGGDTEVEDDDDDEEVELDKKMKEEKTKSDKKADKAKEEKAEDEDSESHYSLRSHDKKETETESASQETNAKSPTKAKKASPKRGKKAGAKGKKESKKHKRDTEEETDAPQHEDKKSKHDSEEKEEKEVQEEHKEHEDHETHIGNKEEIIRDFRDLVNMTGSEIDKWLHTKESKEVGWKGEGGHDSSKESVGHASGRRIIKLLKMNGDDFTDDDVLHMRKVRSYIKRHSAQKPAHDIEHTRWRYSLMNWGHDPAK